MSRTPLTLSSLKNFPFRLIPTLGFTPEEIERTLIWEEAFSSDLSPPRISVRILGHHSRERTEESVRLQSAQKSLTTEDSDYVLLLNSGSVLHPSALFILAKRVLETGAKLIYWDEALFADPALGAPTELLSKARPSKFSALGRPIAGEGALIHQSLHSKREPEGSLLDYLWVHTLSLKEEEMSYIPLVLSSSVRSQPSSVEQQNAVRVAIEKSLNAVGFHSSNVEITDKNLTRESRFTLNPEIKRTGVIVPFRDSSELTNVAIASLAAQTSAANLIVILVDNGSDPAQRQLVHAELRKNHFAHAEIISDPKYFNFARLCNIGWRKAVARGAESVLFMNNDVDLITPDAIEQLAKLLSNPEVGIAGGSLHFPGGRMQSSGITFEGPNNIRLPHHFPESFREVDGVSLGFALVKRELLESLNGLDELRCPNGYGDVLFCHRAKERGFRSVIIPWVTATHRESKSRLRRSEELELFELSTAGVPANSVTKTPSLEPLPVARGAFESAVKHIASSPKLLFCAEALATPFIRSGRIIRKILP